MLLEKPYPSSTLHVCHHRYLHQAIRYDHAACNGIPSTLHGAHVHHAQTLANHYTSREHTAALLCIIIALYPNALYTALEDGTRTVIEALAAAQQGGDEVCLLEQLEFLVGRHATVGIVQTRDLMMIKMDGPCIAHVDEVGLFEVHEATAIPSSHTLTPLPHAIVEGPLQRVPHGVNHFTQRRLTSIHLPHLLNT